jgi:hypothetical protein
MTKERLATSSALLGAALLFGTAAFHLTGYSFVVGRATQELRPLIGAAWVAGGISLMLAAVLAIVAAPLFILRRPVFLLIAALTPLSIAVLQLAYLGFILPTGLLLLDTAILVIAAGLGVTKAKTPASAA